MYLKSFNVIFFHNAELSSTCFLDNHIKSLEEASSSYHQVLEENRFLYNQVQDLKGTQEFNTLFQGSSYMIYIL